MTLHWEDNLLSITLARTCSSVISTWPTATPKHKTFLSWNFMVERTSVILLVRSSECDTGVGNLPALERPGPRRRGICFMRASEARKASYFLASFLTSFLFLLSLETRRIGVNIIMWYREWWHQLLQVIDGHVLEINLLSTVNVCSISKNADSHAGTRNIGKSETRGQWNPDWMKRRVTDLTVPEKRLSRWGS